MSKHVFLNWILHDRADGCFIKEFYIRIITRIYILCELGFT